MLNFVVSSFLVLLHLFKMMLFNETKQKRKYPLYLWIQFNIDISHHIRFAVADRCFFILFLLVCIFRWDICFLGVFLID